MCGYWLWQLINIFYYCDNVSIVHLIPLYHEKKIVELCIYSICNCVLLLKLPFSRKTCYHHLKSRCITELSWNFLKNTNASKYVSIEQPCLKTTRLYDNLLFLSNLFHFSYFIFSVLISFMFSNLSISLFLFLFFPKPSKKAFVCVSVCVYNIYNTYFRTFMKVCLAKKFWFHFFT